MADNNKVVELTNGEFEDFIKEGIVLIDFFAEWCMPCLMIAPIIEELSEKFKGKIKFGKVDIDSNRMIAQKFEVNSIPNLVLFKEGKLIEHFIGMTNAEELEEKLKKFI
jgi:thioredoxin 1